MPPLRNECAAHMPAATLMRPASGGVEAHVHKVAADHRISATVPAFSALDVIRAVGLAP
jgi:hypothetical protein